MPFFSKASRSRIKNSQFTDVTIHQSISSSGIDILFEASVPEAAHDSSARHPPPRCFPGTRKQYVEDIIHWALPPVGQSPLPIHWMKGQAGVGKSAIAQTCAERLEMQGKLGAAFFFSINRHSKSNGISTGNKEEHFKFFTSIAYQLAATYPNYYNLLNVKIRRNKSLIHKTPKSQFLGLIAEPLLELEKKGLGIGERIPIIVDGLDECESRDAQCEIVEIVASGVRDGVPLCWGFFSRPEPHIEATFSDASISSLCCTVVLPVSSDANKDIELYLRAGFEKVLRRLNVTMASAWPSDDDMQKLVRAANGLFIYASTVLRFVGHPDTLNPEESLRAVVGVILGHDQRDGTAEPAFAELDAFYTLIMQRIAPKMFPTIHRLFTVLSLLPFPGVMMVANRAGMSRVELEAACGQMGAVVHFQPQHKSLAFDPAIDTSRSFSRIFHNITKEECLIIMSSLGGSVSFYHKSFQDFLLDQHRSGTYCVNTLFSFIGKRMQDLAYQFEEHYSWQDMELVRVSGVPNSPSFLSYPHVNELTNCIIEGIIYHTLYPGACWSDFAAQFDFRKGLYIHTTVSGAGARRLVVKAKSYAGAGRLVVKAKSYGGASSCKYGHGMLLTWLQPGEFSKFNVAAFKANEIEERQNRNILQPYYPTTPFLGEPQGRAEFGLYTIGNGLKSIFWYWEINYDLGYFRELEMLDLDAGGKFYRKQFGS